METSDSDIEVKPNFLEEFFNEKYELMLPTEYSIKDIKTTIRYNDRFREQLKTLGNK